MKEVSGDRNLPLWGLLAFALWSPISIAATNAAWVAALLLWGFEARRERPRLRALFPPTELNRGFGLFFLASLVSVWTSLNVHASIVEFRSLGLMVIYFLFSWNIRSGRERKRLVLCLLATATLAAAFGIVQHATGWDYTGHYDPASGKAGSFFGLHLTFGEYLVLTTCLSAGILLFANPPVPLFLALIAVSLAMTAGILASGSKGSLLGLLTGSIVLLGLRGKKAVVSACGIGLIAILLILVYKPLPPLHEIASQFVVDAHQTSGSMASNTRRIYMWWSGLRVSAIHLMTGVGLHAVETVYPAFRHPLAKEPNQWHLHNQYIQIGVTRGLFGLAALLYLLLAAFRAGWRRLKRCGDPWDRAFSAGILAGLAGFLVCGLTEYCWGDSEVLMLVYMLLGLLASIPDGNESKRPLSQTNPRAPCPWESARTKIGGIARTCALASILLASFLVPPTPCSGRMQILEAALACVLLVLVSRPVAGKGAPRAAITQAIACITVFAGYAFTRHLWIAAEGFFNADASSCPWAIPVLLSLSALGLVVLWLASSKPVLSLFDSAFFAALGLWAASAFGTNFLLALATGTDTFLRPPFLVLLPLLTLLFCLYCLVRFTFVGGKTDRLLFACTALCMLIHALS